MRRGLNLCRIERWSLQPATSRVYYVFFTHTPGLCIVCGASACAISCSMLTAPFPPGFLFEWAVCTYTYYHESERVFVGHTHHAPIMVDVFKYITVAALPRLIATSGTRTRCTNVNPRSCSCIISVLGGTSSRQTQYSTRNVTSNVFVGESQPPFFTLVQNPVRYSSNLVVLTG